MMKLDHSPSHSWWWDSHHSPKHSRWLQSNLKGLDEKVKAMLNLIEEDADSFAQRAEMYYKKRPELVNLVEEFYRAFRSLAERYDHLTGEIRQNIPKALQVQYGLSCDSPRGSPFGRQHHSPYRRDPQGFERLLQKFGTARSEDQMQSDDSEVMELSSGELRRENSLSQEEGLTSSSDSEVDNSTEVAKVEQAHQSLEEENKKLADRCSINEAENRMLQTRMKEMEAHLVKLQQEKNEWVDKWQISLEEKTTLEDRLKESGYDLSGLQVENVRLAKEASAQVMHSKSLEELCVLLKEEKTFLKEESSEGSEKEIELRKEVELLQIEGANLRAVVLNRENQIRTLQEEMQLLQSEKQRLTSDLSAALEQGKISTTAFRFMKGEVSSLVQRNKKLRGEIMDRSDDAILKVKEEEISNLLDENKTLKSELQTSLVAEERGQGHLNNKIKELHGKLAFLEEENLKQKLLILDRAEEKREAIRQLSFSIDVLKEKNQRLEGALCSAKVRLHGLRNPASSNYVPKWKGLLMGVWNGRKTQPYALAL